MKIKTLFYLLPFLIVVSACSVSDQTLQKDEINNINKQENMQNNENQKTNTATTRYSVDLVGSSLLWTGAKKIGATHNGTLDLSSGFLEIENDALRGGEFIIDMTSIRDSDGSERLEGHLKSDDFFGVENFPEAKLEITKTEKTENGYVITADLTIKGTTQSIQFPANFVIDNNVIMASATIVVDRTLFDVRFGSGKFFENLGDNLINDEFEIGVEVVANKL